MTTQEFFQIAYDHLNEDGVLAINVGRAPGDRSLIDTAVEAVAEVGNPTIVATMTNV